MLCGPGKNVCQFSVYCVVLCELCVWEVLKFSEKIDESSKLGVCVVCAQCVVAVYINI